jgi:hypothetical protein
MKRSFVILVLFVAIAGFLLYVSNSVHLRPRAYEPFQEQGPAQSRLPPPGQVPERGVASPNEALNMDKMTFCKTSEDCARNLTKKLCVSGKCRN